MHFNPSSLAISTTALALLSSFSLLASLASLASASLLPPDGAQRRDTVSSASYYTVQRPPWYGHSPVPHEGEYLYAYSTGSGSGTSVLAAAFTSNKTLAVEGYITNTTTFEVLLDFDASASESRWTLQIPSGSVAQSTAVPVAIEPENGTVGFGYDTGPQPGLWTSAVAGFDGFLACDTSLGITQLYALIKVGDTVSVPSGCVEIDLGKAS
ncbi:hypothetical protein L228DRAFT_267075 [Xylona heveae TC161]|uniref:DUF7907 domain-containing protein n=1 Tax=Xylona heveae (strain CBS 132557 / TC161) TaxID=1328760 RepID=A0A165IE63_XYLHT|nr:hypothetical protein L228DRAFT_267075 [Xylona heveae TC161]KZF24769.1 hypothetical protein L228DRAFT_267075 [Xylona heveae TC161]